jgi:uncharacterized iron-regulated membrane protein
MTRMHLPAMVLALAAAWPVAGQLPEAMSEADLRALLLARGFTDIAAVQFDDGLWSASADAPDGGRAALHVDPRSGAVFLDDATPSLDAEAIEARLALLGYRDIHNPVFEDGVWKVEAETPEGQELLVYLDPGEGDVLVSRSD